MKIHSLIMSFPIYYETEGWNQLEVERNGKCILKEWNDFYGLWKQFYVTWRWRWITSNVCTCEISVITTPRQRHSWIFTEFLINLEHSGHSSFCLIIRAPQRCRSLKLSWCSNHLKNIPLPLIPLIGDCRLNLYCHQ